MVSVNDWIKYQGGRTPVMDTGWVVPAIEGDRTGCPMIEFWGDRLYGIDVPECALALLFGNVSDIDHVHCFPFGGKLLLAPGVLLSGLIVVFTWSPFTLCSVFILPACLKTQQF